MVNEWRTVTGFEGLYMVSDCGLVKRCDLGRDRVLKPLTTSKGYVRVMLSNGKTKKSCQVHRLVATAFVDGALPDRQVNHINGVKSDNRNKIWNG